MSIQTKIGIKRKNNWETYISISSICTVNNENTINNTSNTNCYTEKVFGCLGIFSIFTRLSGQTSKHTFRCDNFLTPQISLYVSETSINTKQKRIRAQRKA